MRFSQSEKMEIIRLVEDSELSVKHTLKEFGIHSSTFYKWYARYQVNGYDGLAYHYRPPKQFWNAIPPWEKKRVVKVALAHPEKTPRELAWYITDTCGYYISESSVYRILKAHNLITSPVFTIIEAKDKFSHPTTHVHQLWQTDFTYLKVIHWGWYFLSTVLDDYSRYIIAWKLCQGMTAEDVKATLDEAIEETGVKHVNVAYRPRLLSDNGACYISSSLKEYLKENNIPHTRGKPYHPMTQGKIERYHRSMKSIINLDNYYSPAELEDQIGLYVAHYNHYRYHESLNNVTPANVYEGRSGEIEERRSKLKNRTMRMRRKQYRELKLENAK